MVTFDDIKTVLASTDVTKLEKDYTKRQENNRIDNAIKAKDVLVFFPDELIYLPKGLDNIGKLNALLMLYLNSGNLRAQRIITEILKKYGYNPDSEIIRAMQMSDLLFQHKIDEDDYKRAINGLTNTTGIMNIRKKEIQIKTMRGIIKMNPLCETLGITPISEEQRQGFCHNITSCVLEANKNLYGGYYYVPLEFKGYMEHSVIIDLNKNLVLDFAQDIMVPLKIWFKFLGEPNLLIDGKSYQELVKQTKEELDVDLNICLLEQVRRRTK